MHPSSSSTMNFMGFFFQPINLAGTALAVILSISIIKIFVGRLAEKKRRYHPIAGTVLHQLANYPSLHHYMTDLAGKHRTYRLLSFLRSEVYTADPINVEYILKTNFPNYGRVIPYKPLEFSLENFVGKSHDSGSKINAKLVAGVVPSYSFGRSFRRWDLHCGWRFVEAAEEAVKLWVLHQNAEGLQQWNL